MQRTPCEEFQWHIIPIIRRELTLCLVEVFSLSNVEVAKKLGLTPAAICQYLHGKRGNGVLDESLHYEIAYSAERIMREGQDVAQKEICRICSIIQKKKD